jgi:hypothetical protein
MVTLTGTALPVNMLDAATAGISTLLGVSAANTPVRAYTHIAYTKNHGVVSDGVTNDYTALQALLNSGATVVILPVGTTYIESGITVPVNVTLLGAAFAPSETPGGSIIKAKLDVATIVTVGGSSAGNGSGTLKNVNVTRAAGTIPANSIGVLVENTYASSCEDVMSRRSSICWKFKSDRASAGITTMLNRIYSGETNDAHIVIDTMPEVRFNQCRFGINGSVDQNCVAFIRITGGSATNAANGPNTIIFQNCQFNQGNGTTADSLIEFVSKTVSSISDTAYFAFDNCYCETVDAFITTDSTWTTIGRLMLSNTSFNMSSSIEFLNLNAGTDLNSMMISNCRLPKFTYTPASANANELQIDNCVFDGTVAIKGNTTATVYLSNNIYKNGLSLTGTFASGSSVSGGSMTGGSLTFTAAGIGLDIGPYNQKTAFTPALKFGGGSTGMTYTAQIGYYTLKGRRVSCVVQILLSAKGSSTGSATITGLPYTPSGDGWSGSVGYVGNISTITYGVDACYFSSALTLVDGNTILTHANFNNNSYFYLSFEYEM